MEELEIVLEREAKEEQEINLISEGEKVLPPLEDIEIKPSTTDKVYKSENYYGYNQVLVKGVESGGGSVLPTVEGNTLIFLSGTVEGGVLNI